MSDRMPNNETSPLAGDILFRLLGVPWTFTRASWRFVPPKLVIGLIIAFLTLPNESLISRILIGIEYGVLLILLLIWHIVGHTLGGIWLHAPMDENHITPTLIETRYYENPGTVPKRIHLIRTLAGPLANLLLAFVSALAWKLWGGHSFAYFALANLVLVVVVILPFPGVDGAVIWRELQR